MIEFKGELSKTCKEFVLKNEVRCSRIALTISCFPFAVAEIICFNCIAGIGFSCVSCRHKAKGKRLWGNHDEAGHDRWE